MRYIWDAFEDKLIDFDFESSVNYSPYENCMAVLVACAMCKYDKPNLLYSYDHLISLVHELDAYEGQRNFITFKIDRCGNWPAVYITMSDVVAIMEDLKNLKNPIMAVFRGSDLVPKRGNSIETFMSNVFMNRSDASDKHNLIYTNIELLYIFDK